MFPAWKYDNKLIMKCYGVGWFQSDFKRGLKPIKALHGISVSSASYISKPKFFTSGPFDFT